MKRILITGATGFTGKKILKLLKKNKNYPDDSKIFLTDKRKVPSNQNYMVAPHIIRNCCLQFRILGYII